MEIQKANHVIESLALVIKDMGSMQLYGDDVTSVFVALEKAKRSGRHTIIRVQDNWWWGSDNTLMGFSTADVTGWAAYRVKRGERDENWEVIPGTGEFPKQCMQDEETEIE